MGLDFSSARSQLARWEGRRVSVAVDRRRLRSGFKPMVVLRGELGASRWAPEARQEPDIQNIPNEDLAPKRRTHALSTRSGRESRSGSECTGRRASTSASPSSTMSEWRVAAAVFSCTGPYPG